MQRANRRLIVLWCFLLLAVAAAPRLSAQPAVTIVTNAASSIVPGLPNAGIAQGAIFTVYGTGLGPANIAFAASAFQSTTLSGTSISITVGGTTTNALMYYTSATQVAALLPSNTPTGTGTITVTYNKQTSATIPITVVANNLGMFTVESSGTGPGTITNLDYSLVTTFKAANCGGPNTGCGAANPGDVLVLWGTGLGPVSGSDASGADLGVNMPNIPLKLWFGGVQAKVSYQGRSGCCVGEDQIVFTVPDNVPTGCAVPLVVQIGDQISNNVLIPVANGNRSCTATNPALASVNVEQRVTAGPVSYGSVKLFHDSDGNGTFEDDGKAVFVKILTYFPGSQSFFLSEVDDQALGTCLVYNNLNQSEGPGPIASLAALDAGTNTTVMGSNGSANLPNNAHGQSSLNPMGSLLVPGSFTLIGTGGADVGPFSANFTIPATSSLTSPVNNATVTRSSGMTVSWTGGAGNVSIQVQSCTDSSCTNGAAAFCTAPASAGSFTIPPYVLEALPAGNNAGVVLTSYAESSFTANGVDVGIIDTFTNDAGFGNGWGSGGFTLK